MAGIFGFVSREKKIDGLMPIDFVFYGTDYHTHLGTRRGGMASLDDNGDFFRYIHDITHASFRSKFEDDLGRFRGRSGIGVISDYEDQPIIMNADLGRFAIVSVNKINILNELVENSFQRRKTHYSETGKGELNPNEVIGSLIAQESDYVGGIENALEHVKGSCSLLLLTKNGIYAARDRLGRTPLVVGKRRDDKAYAATFETGAFCNLGLEVERELGPGEIVLITPEGIEQKKKPSQKMQICGFLWVYYGFPSSTYEGRNVEQVRYKCGAMLARRDKEDLRSNKLQIDFAADIPDSGTAHSIGYANEAKIERKRPFVKYTPTWPRSFMPPEQKMRDLIAKMKLIPIREIIEGKNMLFCEDSIVRGTQLREIVQVLFDYKARAVHMRPSCPPLIYGCEFLNFSRSRSTGELATHRAIKKIEGIDKNEIVPVETLQEYENPDSEKHQEMVKRIRKRLKLTTLKYQKLEDLVRAIGIPKCRICTHCWDKSSCL